MSMFSLPEELMADVKKFEAMTDEMTAMLPPEMASAVNLFVHPFAGAAAASAVGFGLASQGFGLWLGTVSAMLESSQRLFSPVPGEFAGDIRSFESKPRSPSTKARSATKTLIEDAQSTALEIAGVAVDGAGTTARPEPVIPAVADASAGLLPEDFRQPRSMPKPKKADDLKAISGIGPKLETVLNGLGVWTYAQIAAWTKEEIAWVDDYLSFKGRIGRDDWIGQAGKLAGKPGGGKRKA
jgi:NADH-quinone oxidoreductase subunit E